MTSFNHPIKCMACGLHFTVWSWSETWPNREDEDEERPIFCPECGGQKHIKWEPESSSLEIFEYVPGMAQLKSVGV